MKKGNQQNTRKRIIGFILVMGLLVVGALGIYYQYMKKQQAESAGHTPTTEVEKLIAKDLEMGYPETPTEVMKLWGRFNQCIYNSSYGDEQFETLLKQLRLLYSTDLLEQNPEKTHSANLKKEVNKFKEDKGNIVSYSAETGKSVQYQTINNRECANIRLSYFINKKGNYTKNYQDFILVKENNRWKILGFKEADTKESSEKKTDKSKK